MSRNIITETVIQSICGRFKFVHIVDLDEPYLQVFNKKDAELALWDNHLYLKALFVSLKTESHTAQYMDLMFYCSEWGFDFDEVKKILSEIYTEALGLGIFEE